MILKKLNQKIQLLKRLQINSVKKLPSVMLYLGGIRSIDGNSTAGSLVYNVDGVTNSALTPLPKGRFFNDGTYLESLNALIVCGGYSSGKRVSVASKGLDLNASSECFILNEPQGKWKPFIKLPIKLAEAAVVGYKSKLFIMGGLSSQPDKHKLSTMSCTYMTSLNDKEIIASNPDDDVKNDTEHEKLWRWSRSDLDLSSIDNSSYFSRNIRQFNLDGHANDKHMHCLTERFEFGTASACISLDEEKIDKKKGSTIYITGGRNSTNYHTTVYQMTLSDVGQVKSLKKMSQMRVGRSSHGCAVFNSRKSKNKYLVVAGGIHFSLDGILYLSSVEILDLTSHGSKWKSAKPLNKARAGFALISNSQGIISAIGGWPISEVDQIEKNSDLVGAADWTRKKFCSCKSESRAFGTLIQIPRDNSKFSFNVLVKNDSCQNSCLGPSKLSAMAVKMSQEKSIDENKNENVKFGTYLNQLTGTEAATSSSLTKSSTIFSTQNVTENLIRGQNVSQSYDVDSIIDLLTDQPIP